jgi:homoserine O-acetyltransferase/O-succinyltransferase
VANDPNDLNTSNQERHTGGSPAPSSATAAGPWRTVWRPGDEPGRRRFARVGSISLEVGRTPWGNTIPDVTVCFESWGELDAQRSNAVLLLHGFTADSHAGGPVGPGHPEAGWWEGLIGSGLPFDTDRFFVICPNVLGGCQGTTGPASLAPDGEPWGSRWPRLTVRDLVAAERALADQLGIERWHGVVGPSLGGMRALEWAVGTPARVANMVLFGVGATTSAEQIAIQSIQLEAIRGDDQWCGGDYYDKGDGRGPVRGMALARKVGHISYRSELELEQRFGNRPQQGENPVGGDGRYGVQSYLDYAAQRLERRFDPNTYLTLSDTMNHHDVGRDRGGVAAAMRTITARTTVVGLAADRLYPPRQQREIAELLGVELHLIDAITGHDAFLTDLHLVGPHITAGLAER